MKQVLGLWCREYLTCFDYPGASIPGKYFGINLAFSRPDCSAFKSWGEITAMRRCNKKRGRIAFFHILLEKPWIGMFEEDPAGKYTEALVQYLSTFKTPSPT